MKFEIEELEEKPKIPKKEYQKKESTSFKILKQFIEGSARYARITVSGKDPSAMARALGRVANKEFKGQVKVLGSDEKGVYLEKIG